MDQKWDKQSSSILPEFLILGVIRNSRGKKAWDEGNGPDVLSEFSFIYKPPLEKLNPFLSDNPCTFLSWASFVMKQTKTICVSFSYRARLKYRSLKMFEDGPMRFGRGPRDVHSHLYLQTDTALTMMRDFNSRIKLR